MTVKKCDRCGAVFDDSSPRTVGFQEDDYKPPARITCESPGYSDREFDLCPDCMLAFKSFMEEIREALHG